MSSEPPRTVWFALAAPPLAWFTALTAGYFMVSWACGSTVGRVTLHGTVLAMLTLSVAAALTAARFWRREGAEWPGKSPDPTDRTRFLAVIAGFGGTLFSLAILGFWIAALVLSPCEPGPRTPFAPSAGAESTARERGHMTDTESIERGGAVSPPILPPGGG